MLLKPGPCACGSAFPAFHVTSRTDDLLDLPARGGKGTVTATPLSLVTVIEETPGVYRVQVLHRALADLEIRLQVQPGADTGAIWAAVTTRVRGYLDEQGACPVTPHYSAEPRSSSPGAASMPRSSTCRSGPPQPERAPGTAAQSRSAPHALARPRRPRGSQAGQETPATSRS